MAAAVLGGASFSLAPTASPGVTPSATISHTGITATTHVILQQTTLNEDVRGSITAVLENPGDGSVVVKATRQLTDTLSGKITIFDIA